MDAIRNGNITSSEIYKITTTGKQELGFGGPAIGYLEECLMERRLGLPIEGDVGARPLSWGNLIEQRAFDHLDLSYTICSSETIGHPEIDYWYGSPDAVRMVDIVRHVSDIKCPMSRKSFCQLVDPYYEKGKLIHPGLSIEAVRANHKDGEKFFWQIVSNAILTNSRVGELIVYMPYKSELEEIRDLASSAGEAGEYAKWIYFSTDEALPHIIDGGHYKNINIIQFDILQKDIDFLTERVKLCGTILNR